MRKEMVILVASLTIVALTSCRKQQDSQVEKTLEAEGSTQLRRTGASVVAEVTAEDPLIVDGQFSCYEAEIQGGSEEGKHTVELDGGSIRSREGGRFSLLIEYVIRSGEAEVKGSQEWISVQGRPSETIHLTREPADITYPDGPSDEPQGKVFHRNHLPGDRCCRELQILRTVPEDGGRRWPRTRLGTPDCELSAVHRVRADGVDPRAEGSSPFRR